MAGPVSQEQLDKLAELRADFMRRWFAIAISVGFAATVVAMHWVQDGRAPNYEEWEQLARLTVALVATVLSWEGYLRSISDKKLYEFPRYAIDIFLVFVYLFLLLTSKFSHFWLALHALILALYIFWDYLTAMWHPEWYRAHEATPVWKIYVKGLVGSDVDRGLSISLVWAAYFTWVWVVSLADFRHETFVLAAFVAFGLWGYRYNKGRYRDDVYYSYATPLGVGLALTLVVLMIQPVGESV